MIDKFSRDAKKISYKNIMLEVSHHTLTLDDIYKSYNSAMTSTHALNPHSVFLRLPKLPSIYL